MQCTSSGATRTNMDKETKASIAVKQLKEAGKDSSKQVPALFKLGECYFMQAKTTRNGVDFTKANALFNAALVRSRNTIHEIDEKQILRRIVETYREYLRTFGNDGNLKLSVDEIHHEIDSHKEWIAHERSIFKERLGEIDSSFNPNEEVMRNNEVLRWNNIYILAIKYVYLESKTFVLVLKN